MNQLKVYLHSKCVLAKLNKARLSIHHKRANGEVRGNFTIDKTITPNLDV